MIGVPIYHHHTVTEGQADCLGCKQEFLPGDQVIAILQWQRCGLDPEPVREHLGWECPDCGAPVRSKGGFASARGVNEAYLREQIDKEVRR